MKPIIEYPDYEKLDIRLGRVISATIPDWSKKLIEYRVDFGDSVGEKTILSGIKAWYVPDDLVGRIYPFIINLSERKMGESISQGMMLMAVPEVGKPTLFEVNSNLEPGTVLR